MIDYGLLHQSVGHYEEGGFKRIEAPWLVSEATSAITKPEDAIDYVVHYGGKKKSFVASGEQSFLYLMNKGFLPKGKYQTITPCMRHETFDDYHTKYFMKNELIITNVDRFSVDEIVETARWFFFLAINIAHDAGRFASFPKLEIISTGVNQYDIELNGVEIGSYGYRKCNFGEWVYGTGLAEPRFTRILNHLERD